MPETLRGLICVVALVLILPYLSHSVYLPNNTVILNASYYGKNFTSLDGFAVTTCQVRTSGSRKNPKKITVITLKLEEGGPTLRKGSKRCWRNGKKCGPSGAIWSGSTLFVRSGSTLFSFLHNANISENEAKPVSDSVD